MAKKTPTSITIAPDVKALRLKKDGTPWTAVADRTPRRSNADMLLVYRDKLVKARARHAKEIAGINKKIAYFENAGSKTIDPIKANAAAQEYLSKGMTSDQILAAAEQLRLAAYAVKGKSDEELAAIAHPPAFFAVTAPDPE